MVLSEEEEKGLEEDDFASNIKVKVPTVPEMTEKYHNP